MSAEKIRWGILGTADIARKNCPASRQIPRWLRFVPRTAWRRDSKPRTHKNPCLSLFVRG